MQVLVKGNFDVNISNGQMKIKAVILTLLLAIHTVQGQAQVTEIISVVKAAITRVVKAIDLQVQRMQTKTIWLQNLQKELENSMSKLKLEEITGWVQRQRDLYASYYQELSSVKGVILNYEKVKGILSREQQLVLAFRSAYSLFSKDRHFSAKELEYIYQVDSGILSESLKNIDELLLALNVNPTQMTDAARLGVIDQVAVEMQHRIDDLNHFNQEQIQLSLQRALAEGDIQNVKTLYQVP